MSRRIYLNPTIGSAVPIFQEIVDAADAAGIMMQGKVLDRLAEGVSPSAQKGVGQFNLRADGIVLYAGKDIDALLNLTNSIYMQHGRHFTRRKTPKIPLRVADGVAIGDNPATGSLTSHRAELLEMVKSATLADLGDVTTNDAQVIAAFRRNYAKIATQENVSLDNIAFNANP